MAYVAPHMREQKEPTTAYKPDKFEIGLTGKALGSFRDAKPINSIIKKYVKSCQAYLSLSDYDLTVTEMLKFPNIEKNKSGTLEDNFLDDLINNFKLKERYTDTPIYCGEVELYSIVKANQSVKTPEDEKKKFNYNCKIDRETFSVEPEMKLRMYFQQIAQTELKKINSVFWWKTKKFIITPQQPFSPEIEQQWDTIQKTSSENPEKKHIVKSFLGFIKFQYYSKILTINELFDDDFDVKKLEDIKTNIKIFYKRNFDYDITNDYMLYITLNNSNDNTNQLVFDFYTYDATLGYLYVSFIDRQTNPRIEIIIDRIKNKNFYYYGKKYKSEKECIRSNDHFTEPFNKPRMYGFIYEHNNYNYIFGISNKTNKIKIINEYNYPNKYHTYCAIFLLIKIDNKYYEISIKSITAQIIRNYETTGNAKYRKFYENYKKCLITLLSKSPIIQHNNKNYLWDKLPAYIELYVKPIDITTYILPINIYYIDTIENYTNIILKEIKKATISLEVMLCLLWGKQLIEIHTHYHNTQSIKETQIMYLLNKLPYVSLKKPQQYFLQLTQGLLRTTTGYYILGYIEYSTNFIQIIKNTCEFDTILKEIINNTPIPKIQSMIFNLSQQYKIPIFTIDISLLSKKSILEQFINYINNEFKEYLIWYLPQITIRETHKDELLFFINNITLYENNKKHISQLTTFYDLYQEDNFCHNIRHLTDALKDELKTFTTDSTYDYGCHYPNIFKYAIFHLHKNKRTFTPEKEDDLIQNYHNINSIRYILLSDILSRDFSIIDISVVRIIKLKITDFIDFDIKKIQKTILLDKIKKCGTPQYYLDNILNIIKNNGFILV